jgi:D-serine deaminase-like pyridoxal phosphate-dependent protein
MGYEGHLMMVEPENDRKAQTEEAMKHLLAASADVGGDLVSGGGTGTYAVNTWVNEIQAGSYTLMDTAYDQLGLPFEQALFVLGRVISTSTSVSGEWAVADVGLKSLSLDHGLPRIDGYDVWFCSDEHTTFRRLEGGRNLPGVGERIRVAPSHVDPTVALHDAMYLIDGEDVLEEWPIDMRGWR